MNSVYLLLSDKDGRTYVGSTTDLNRRLIEHNSGKVMATKNRRPLKLFFREDFKTIEEARSREKYFKTAAGRKWLKKNVFNE